MNGKNAQICLIKTGAVIILTLLFFLTAGCGGASTSRSRERELQRKLERTEDRLEEREKTIAILQERLADENDDFYVKVSAVLSVLVIVAFFAGIILGSGAKKNAQRDRKEQGG